MLSDEWLSRYGLLENFNASVTRTGTGTGTGTHTGTGTWTTGVTAIALCTSCSRAKNGVFSPLEIYNHMRYMYTASCFSRNCSDWLIFSKVIEALSKHLCLGFQSKNY